MLTGIAHVCFVVRDLDESIAFYEKLGLKIAFEFRNEEKGRFGVYLKVGRRTFIELFKGEPDAPAKNQSYGHFCVEVDNLEKTVAAFRARGVEVSNPLFGSDQSWQAWITDPSGNRIELHEYTLKSWQTPHLG